MKIILLSGRLSSYNVPKPSCPLIFVNLNFFFSLTFFIYFLFQSYFPSSQMCPLTSSYYLVFPSAAVTYVSDRWVRRSPWGRSTPREPRTGHRAGTPGCTRRTRTVPPCTRWDTCTAPRPCTLLRADIEPCTWLRVSPRDGVGNIIYRIQNESDKGENKCRELN